jgi:response regulator of citrate/malate metabolism
MSGVYTSLAKKRVEQSKEPVSAVPVTQTEQKLNLEQSPLSQKMGEEKVDGKTAESKKSESQKVNKIKVEKIVRKSESQQNDLSESQQSDKANLSTKTAKRFTTYLTKASLRAIRIIADDEERHDYEVFQEAIDFYLTHRKQ